MRKTKIVCTIGPATDSPEMMKKLLEAGMNVGRLNFSHGTHEEHAVRIEKLRQAAQDTQKVLAIMLDTKGPEIRTGYVEGDRVFLKQNSRVRLTTEAIKGDETCFSINNSQLPQAVAPGNMIMIADGMLQLKVLASTDTEIECQVIVGGNLGNQKNVNVSGVKLDLPALTEKDIEDIHFGIEHDVDFIAASFVRRSSDVLAIRRILESKNADIHIISKIENEEGVNNLDEIIKVSDGIMVARGDMGVVIPAQDVPLIQKEMISKCNRLGKPVVTATQMLDSMIRNPRPTRAEASDVANAIFDGTDAVMLSGETAAGKYPLETVMMMARIAERTEEALDYDDLLQKRTAEMPRTTTDAISHATCTIAHDLGVAAIITSTRSGFTARMVSKYRPKAPIIAVSPEEKVIRKLCLIWGVQPLGIEEIHNTDEMIERSVEASLAKGLIKSGDLLVITAGVPVPFGVPGTTNLIKVHAVGKILARGTGIGNRAVVGKVRICMTPQEAFDKIKTGDIVVAASTDRDYIAAIQKAGAIITEEGGLTSYAAIVGLNLGIPVIVGVDGATKQLKDGATITVDSMRGLVYQGSTTVL